MNDVFAAPLLPMLATPATPFDDPGYRFEIKWNGVRVMASIASDGCCLWGRHGVNYSDRYPELALLRRLPAGTVVDGEVIVLRAGRADFPALLRRHQRRRRFFGPPQPPVSYVLFDVLRLKGRSLLKEPLARRRALLEELLAGVHEPVLGLCPGVVGGGRAYFAEVVAQGHEGLIAKDLGSRYWPGKRSQAWRKLKPVEVVPCVVVGYRPGQRGEVQALQLATVRDGELCYVGELRHGLGLSVGSGLAPRLQARRRSQPVVHCRPACIGVEPELYCRVRFRGWTPEGWLRQPVFAGWLQAADTAGRSSRGRFLGSEGEKETLALR